MALKLKWHYTSLAANLTGFAASVTGSTFTLTNTTIGDDLAHLVTIDNLTNNSHADKTITVVGTNAHGAPLTETITGPGPNQTVSTTHHFLTLTSVTPSSTIGADTFAIGWGDESVSTWQYPNLNVDKFSVRIGVILHDPTKQASYTIQYGYGDQEGIAFNHATLVNLSTTSDGSIDFPVAAIRLLFNTAGHVEMIAWQTTERGR